MTEPEDLERALTNRRPLWHYLLGFTVVLVALIVGYVLWPASPSPYRVLIATHGCEAEPAGRLVSSVRGPLSVSGFRVLEIQDGPPAADPEHARRLAFEAHAQYSVFVAIETLEARDRGAIEPAYVHVRGHAVVGDVAGGPLVPIAPVEIGAFGSTRTAALTDAAERVGEALADAIHLAILQRPAVAAFLEDNRVATDEITNQSSMRTAHERVEHVIEEQGWMAGSCEEAQTELERDEGSARVTCVSGACAEEYAFDVLADGSAALVHSETPSVRIPLVGELVAAERVESVERLELVPLDGSERRVLATADNYYTYPSMSADGRRIAFVEEWPRGFGLVVIDVEDGARTAIARFDRRVQSPHLSSDGATIIASLRAGRRAPRQLIAIDAQVGATLRLLGESHIGRWVHVASAPDAEPRDLVAELVPIVQPEEPTELGEPTEPTDPTPAPVEPLEEGQLPRLELERQLAIIDPVDGSILARMEDDRHRVRRVIGARDGAVVFAWFNGRACGLGRWRPGAEASFVVTEGCLRHAHLGSDGSVFGAAAVTEDGDPRAGDDEIVQVGPDGGPLVPLTANGLRERYPRGAASADRVIFDRLGESRYRAFPRVALCWLER